MKLTILAVITLALGAFALVANGVEEGASGAPKCPPSSSPNCATPTATPTPTPPPQQREDQIPVASEEFRFETPTDVDWRSVGLRPAHTVAVDATDYPGSASLRLEVGVERIRDPNNPTGGCVRLSDTTNGAVPGSEICWSAPIGTGRDNARVRSGPFFLPSGEHEYDVEGKPTLGMFFLHEIRIIVEWTE